MGAPERPARLENGRRDLMDIAIDCFARYGYQGTSIDRIAKAAGVTKGALYYHFKDKEELLFEAVTERVGEFERHVIRDVGSIQRRGGGAARVADACFDHATMSNHRRFIVTLMVEALDTNPRLSAQFREILRRFRAFLRGIIDVGQRQGVFRADVSAITAAGVYAGAVMGAEIQYYQDPEHVDLGRHLRHLRRPVSRVAAPPRARRGRRRNSDDQFQPTEEQQLLRETVAQLRARADPARGARGGRDRARSREPRPAGWELGLVQNAIPEAFGGYGEHALGDHRRAGRARSSPTAISRSRCTSSRRAWSIYPVLELGTEAQKKRRAARLHRRARSRAGTAAVIEPRWDFDLTALTTTATQRQRRRWCSTAASASCRSPPRRSTSSSTRARDGRARRLHRAARHPGLHRRRAREEHGPQGARDLRGQARRTAACPAAARLRRRLHAARSTARAWRSASLAVGVARAAFDYARDYAKERKAFGVAIAQKQAIAFMLADMAIEIDATRLLAWEAAWKLDRGEDATREACLAKHYAANMVLKITDNAVQVLGGHGYIRDHLVELFLRNARGFSTFDGLAIALRS